MVRRRAARHEKRDPGGETPRRASGPEIAKDRLRPWLLGAACGLWVVRPLYPSEGAASRGDGLPVVMLWLALAVFWLLGAIGRRQFRLRFGWIDAGLLLAIGLHTVSALWATTHGSPRPAVNMLWEWVGFGVGFFLTRQLVDGPCEARAVIAVMAALGVALASYGMYHSLYEMAEPRQLYRDNPDEALKAAGVWYPPGSPGRETFRIRLESLEPLGTFALTNSLAGYLAPWLVMMLGIGVLVSSGSRRSRGGDGTVRSREGEAPAEPGANAIPTTGSSARQEPRPPQEARPFNVTQRDSDARSAAGRWQTIGLWISRSLRRWARWAAGRWQIIGLWIAVIPVAACLLLTKSRSAYLATLLGIVLLGIGAWRQRIRIPRRVLAVAGAAVAILIAAAIAFRGLDVEVITEATKSLGYRFQYWTSTMEMIAEHPIFGCGPGNFQQSYEAYKLPEASEEVADPHNFLLEIWATAGTPAMLAFVAALVGFFVMVLKDVCSAGQRPLLRQTVGQRIGQTGMSPEGQTGVSPGGETGTSPVGQTRMSALLRRPVDQPLFVFEGGLLGFLAAVPIALLTAAPAKYPVLYIGLPLAIAAGAILAGWVQRGAIPPSLPALGVLVLLVDLSAAGGIGFAGVAGTLWILMALGLNLRERDAGRAQPRWGSLGLLAGSIGLFISCYSSGYGPVVRCQAAMESARRNPLRQEQYLQEAALADPLSAEPWSQSAALAFDLWKQITGGSLPRGWSEADVAKAGEILLGRFEQCTGELAKRAPNSSPAWFAAGERYEQVYDKTGKRPYLEKGIECYGSATGLYPNNATYHGRLAISMRKMGDVVPSQEEATLALRLDDLNPHSDKKLDRKLRNSLERIESNRN